MRPPQDVALTERLAVKPVVGRTREELESAFAALTRHRPDALTVHAWYGGSPEGARIAAFAARARIAAISGSTSLVREGLLMSYAPNYPSIVRRGAYHIDKILKGAKPADLPVERE